MVHSDKGPSSDGCQCDFVVDTVKAMYVEGSKGIEPTREAEEERKTTMDAIDAHTLFPCTDSWWNASNIPGNKAENHNYVLGSDTYEAQCREKMAGWKGFNVDSAVDVSD